MNSEDFIPTRSSLLKRLKDWEDQASWQDFFDTYGKLIYGVARKAGLNDAEGQDVVQETLLVVAKKMPEFTYDPTIGSFKNWLLLITRRRIDKQRKQRSPGVRSSFPEETPRTATVERVPDPAGFDLEVVWEEEWGKNLAEAAIARVKRQVKARQFQMFDLYVLKQWPVKEVARALDVSIGQVYVNKHRISGLIKKEMRQLETKQL